MRAVVLVNPASGAATPAADVIAAHFADAGVEAIVRPFGSDLAEAVRRAAAEVERGAADAVVVGGGDGTIRAAAEALGGRPVPLGVLPMGTFNHFARGLGLPTDLAAAAKTIAEGVARPVSAGRVNGHLFLNHAALGLAPDIAAMRTETHGSRLLRAVSTVPVAVRALLRMRRLRLDVDLDGQSVVCRTPFVFISPNTYAPHLFSFEVLDRRSDGRLNILLTMPDGPADALRMAVHVLRGHLDRHLDLTVAGHAVLTARRPVVRVLLDGDVFRLSSPLTVDGVAEAVHIIGAG